MMMLFLSFGLVFAQTNETSFVAASIARSMVKQKLIVGELSTS
jgi:hypothetical protein